MSDGKSDILVVGAGPAGAAAGIRLARLGFDVCIVDRESFPRPKTCGDALSNRAVRLVEDLGAGKALKETPRAAVLGATAIFPDGSKVSRRFDDMPGCVMPRADFDNIMINAATDAGARVLQGIEVRDFTSEGSGVNGAIGERWRWRAKLVIACDGAGSAAWKTLNIDRPRGRSLAVAATVYMADLPPGPLPGFGEHYFDEEIPCGYGWIFPAVNGLSNVGVYQRSDFYKKGGMPLKKVLNRFLAKMRDRLGDGRRVGKARSSSIPLSVLKARRAAPGLMTCGDAGCFADPLSGEGIWQALQTGTLAAEVAGQALFECGRFDERWALRYQRMAMLKTGWQSAFRRGAPDAIRWLIDNRLYRLYSVRKMLQLCYKRGLLEVSKDIPPSHKE